MTDEITLAMRHPHGTRVRYVLGCRCKPCTASNTALYHARQKAIAAAAASVTPSGPPIPSTLERGGKTYSVLRCPGAEGRACVAGGAWLKGQSVCKACVERATVWNGLVDAARARRHLAKLSAAGVGRRTVSDIAGVADSTLQEIRMGRKRRIRAQVERRILAVTKDATTDAKLVDAAATHKRIAWLLAQGFTKSMLAARLGSTAKTPALQIGKRARVTARTEHQVERLFRSFQ